MEIKKGGFKKNSILPHTTVDIPTKLHEVWWKESKIILNHPFFCFHGNSGKVCPTDSDCFDLSRSTNCWCCSLLLCNGNSSSYYYSSTHFCPLDFSEMLWSNFMKPWRNIICHVKLCNGRHFECVQLLQQLPHTTVDIPTKFHEVWWKESKHFLNPPFFVSMAAAAKFVQPIPIVLAYLAPISFIKLHETS
jgi:hypothetical protein